MKKFVIYQSDPTQTQFWKVCDADNEQHGRDIMAQEIMNKVCTNGIPTASKAINLFLYEGDDNKSGTLVTAVSVFVQNRS